MPTEYTFTFPSHNGRDQVRAWKHLPDNAPRAVIQLMHGFCEHSRRYLHMIDTLNRAGFAVYCDDHIGHGQTGVDNHAMGDSHANGYETYLSDEKTLHDIAVSEHPGVPFMVFGHSWGSMLARGYAARYGEDLAALMLCGLVSRWQSCSDAYYNETLREAYRAHPHQIAGDLFSVVFADMNARVRNPVNDNAWLAVDPSVAIGHVNDPLNAKNATVELLWDLVALGHELDSDAWASQLPAHVPVYIIGGSDDPVGGYGEGLYYTAELLKNLGKSSTLCVYEGYRHEIQNDPAIRDQVEKGIVDFVNAHI